MPFWIYRRSFQSFPRGNVTPSGSAVAIWLRAGDAAGSALPIGAIRTTGPGRDTAAQDQPENTLVEDIMGHAKNGETHGYGDQEYDMRRQR